MFFSLSSFYVKYIMSSLGEARSVVPHQSTHNACFARSYNAPRPAPVERLPCGAKYRRRYTPPTSFNVPTTRNSSIFK